MNESFIVYILYSERFLRTYVGQTNNLEKRLIRHNKGLVTSTRAFKPWKVIYSSGYSTRAEAMKKEKWLKSGAGRRYIDKLLFETKTTGVNKVIASA